MLRDKMRWTAYSDLLEDEYRQCLQEGLQVEPLLEEIRRIQTLSDGSLREEEARSLLARLEAAPVRSDFPYEEPEDYESIQSTLRPTAHKIWPVDADHFTDRIAGAWYGRTVGCVLGIPVEGWPRSKITGYLKASGQYPITEYLHSTQDPALRAQFDIHEEDPTTPYDRTRVCWRECLDAYPNDDDLNYTVLALKLLERYGHNFTSADVAETWLLGIPAFHACTAERVAIRNLMTGILPPQTGRRRNPYREWIGAQIRADFFGYIAPGNPAAAAAMAYRDGVVSHTKNGVYGEMFIAAWLSLCYVEGLTMLQRVQNALEQIPPRSRLSEAISEVCASYVSGVSFQSVVDGIHARYNETLQFDWCLTIPNAMLVTACVLWHDDYDAAVTAAVLSGFDTDCNGATVGSLFGLSHGRHSIPSRWHEAFPPVIHTSVHGYHALTFPDAIERTRNLILLES